MLPLSRTSKKILLIRTTRNCSPASKQQQPSLKPVYAASLRNVNQYISDARATLAQDPSDEEARMYLRQAYAQKAMLYRMGTSRSFNESSSGQ